MPNSLELAAENARLRAALKNHKHTDACLSYAAEKRHRYCITECRDSYEAALAAPPTAAAQAVEAMRRALEGTTCKCRHCCPRRCFDCDVMIDSYCPGCGNEYKAEELLVVQCARCAALAAWKEATRG